VAQWSNGQKGRMAKERRCGMWGAGLSAGGGWRGKPGGLGDGSGGGDVAGVEGGGGLEEEDFDLVLGDGAVLDPSGHDEELAGVEGDGAVAELHDE